MASTIKDKGASEWRSKWKTFYRNKYEALWLERFRIKGVTPQQELYIKRRFWNGEKLACYKAVNLSESFLGGLPPEAQKTLTEGNATAGFAPFAVSSYSQYDAPITGTIVNDKGAPYIPQGSQVVGRDVVLLNGIANEAQFSTLVKTLLDAIVNVEMQARKNGILATSSGGVEVGADCPTRAEELSRKFMSDDAVVAIEGGETAQLRGFSANVPYLVDKYRIEKEARESELKCLLGLDSVATEKKERLITKEAESKEIECCLSADVFLNPLKRWFAEIEKVLGYHFEIEDPFERKEKKGEDDGNDKNNV